MFRRLLTTIAVTAIAFSGFAAQAASLGRVAFVQWQQLWVKDLPGGNALLIDKDKKCSKPMLSQDGDWLAYMSGDVLKIVHRSGKFSTAVARIGVNPEFSWSPKKDVLAYLALDRSLRTVTFTVDKSRIKLSDHKLTSAGDSDVTGIWSYRWSADGDHLAFVRVDRFGKMGPMNMPGLQSSVWKIDVDGKNPTKLLNAGANTYLPILAAWSPDSRWLFFWKDLMYSGSMLADGVPLSRLSTNGGEPKDVVPEMLAYSDFISFSPDGNRFAVTASGDRFTWTSKRLAIVDAAKASKTVVTTDKEIALSPSWSSVGYEIAYVSAPDQAKVSDMSKVDFMSRKISILNTNSMGSRVITRDLAFRDEYPRWSADGKTLLIVRVGQNKKASLWTMDHNGRKQMKVIPEFASGRGSDYYGYTDWSEYFDWWNKKPN